MKKKEWSILIYSNGNNELEPEMWKSKLSLEKIGSTEETNVIIQIGRGPKEIISIMRPQEKFIYEEDKWTGVRRYYVVKNNSKLIEKLDNVNMSSYKTLYNFIEWGIKNYPAKRYMVIVAGHGFTVAALSDLTLDKPYTMGVYELCNTFNLINKNLGVNIDILALDICNMNNVEVIYEVGKNKEESVKYILTFIEAGPLTGMPYDEILKIITENNNIKTEDILIDIINKIDEDLIAIKINHAKITKVKYLLNQIGYKKLEVKEQENKNDDINIFIEYEKELKRILMQLIVHYKLIDKSLPLINIISGEDYNIENIDLFLKFYYKLSFTKNNYWASIVGKKDIKDKLNIENSKMEDYLLTKNNLFAFIKVFNINLPDEVIENQVVKLLKYRGWK